MRRIVDGPGPPAELRPPVVGERLLDLRFGVHHERPVLRDGLADRPGLQHQTLDGFVTGYERDRDVGLQQHPGRVVDVVAGDAQAVSFEDVQRAHGLRAARGRQLPSRAGVEPHRPDREVRVRSRCPRVRRRRWRCHACERAGDDGDLGAATVVVGDCVARDVGVPQHREVRVDTLVGRGQVEPDLEQLDGIRLLVVEQREHLAVDDAVAGGEPLHVTVAEAGRCTERIRVIDEAAAHEGDRLEPAMRMLREARDIAAVVHAPTVAAGEVLTEVAAVERGVGAEPSVAARIRVVVVHTEQERVDGGPTGPQLDDLQDGIVHGRNDIGPSRRPSPRPGFSPRDRVRAPSRAP